MGNGWSIKLGLMGNHGVVAQLFVCCVCLIVLFSVRTSKLCTLLLLFFVEAMKYKLNWLVGWLVFGYRDTRTGADPGTKSPGVHFLNHTNFSLKKRVSHTIL
jgi:hypothetical protein